LAWKAVTTALAFDDDEQVKAGVAAALLISGATALGALAAAQLPHDQLGGCST
jgi:hypothetical protein